jgi:hypothetical protein
MPFSAVIGVVGGLLCVMPWLSCLSLHPARLAVPAAGGRLAAGCSGRATAVGLECRATSKRSPQAHAATPHLWPPPTQQRNNASHASPAPRAPRRCRPPQVLRRLEAGPEEQLLPGDDRQLAFVTRLLQLAVGCRGMMRERAYRFAGACVCVYGGNGGGIGGTVGKRRGGNATEAVFC